MSTKTEQRCQKRVRHSTWHSGQCSRRAVKDGYCKQHHPDALAQREAEAAAKHKSYMVKFRLERAAPELVALVREARDYLSGIPETAAGGDDEAVSLTRKLDTLLASIEGNA